jgi:hypothetical protein
MDYGMLNVEWTTIHQDIRGREQPEAAFANQKLIMNESTYTVIVEKLDRGVLNDTDDNIDIYVRSA